MNADTFIELLGDKLSEYEETVGHRLVPSPLGQRKQVADATTKFLLSDRGGRPIAVAICSGAVSPDLVMRGVKTAESIRSIIGARLGDAIIQPIGSGYSVGRSFAILPWYSEFSSWRPVRVAQRLAISRSLQNWLREVTTVSAAGYSPSSESSSSFYRAIEHLTRQTFWTGDLAVAGATSLRRIESERWRPRHTIDHNDLWLGNVLLNRRHPIQGGTSYRFVIIDWVGANAQGHGVYDLIRLARGLKISDAGLRRQLELHRDALHCDLEDLCGHLLASLGRLYQHLEHFPKEKFVETLRFCWARFIRALPEVR